MSRCIVLVTSLLLFPGYLLAAEAVYRFDQSLSIEEGCKRAEHRLRREVLKEQCGSSVSGIAARLLSNTNDNYEVFEVEAFAGFSKAATPLKRKVRLLEMEKGTVLECHVRGDLFVRCNDAKRDENFGADFGHAITLDEYEYQDGDELRLKLHASSDMYLNVVQILPYRDEAQRVLPNRYQPQVKLDGGNTYDIPQNHAFVVRLPKGHQEVTEYLIAIASKQPVKAPEKTDIAGFFDWLLAQSSETRREAFVAYHISSAVKNSSKGLTQSLARVQR